MFCFVSAVDCVNKQITNKLTEISGLCREADEICALLNYYAE